MAYYNMLDNNKQLEIEGKIFEQITAEHDAAYYANLSKAKSKRQKDKCARKYVGPRFRLRNDLTANKVTNLHVYDCLRIERVIGDTLGVEFTTA